MTASPALEGESEAVGVAVTHRKATDRKFATVDDPTRRQRNELQWSWRPSLAPQTSEHPDDDFERSRAAVNCHDAALPHSQSRKETRNAEHVVEMAMRQQEPVEPPKADPAAQQLALRPLSAIHQDALICRLDEKPRMVAFGRRNAR
jgi:hypothetical protein